MDSCGTIVVESGGQLGNWMNKRLSIPFNYIDEF